MTCMFGPGVALIARITSLMIVRCRLSCPAFALFRRFVTGGLGYLRDVPSWLC